LKDGDARAGDCGPLGEIWSRWTAGRFSTNRSSLCSTAITRWPRRNEIELQHLKGEHLLTRRRVRDGEDLSRRLGAHGLLEAVTHEVESDHDLIALVDSMPASVFVPASAPDSPQTRAGLVKDLDMQRTVSVYWRGRAPAITSLWGAAQQRAPPIGRRGRLAGRSERAQQVVDLHPFAIVGIEITCRDDPSVPMDEVAGIGSIQAALPYKVGTSIRRWRQFFPFRRRPDRQVERQRVAIIDVGQDREGRLGFDLQRSGELRFSGTIAASLRPFVGDVFWTSVNAIAFRRQ